MFLLLFGCVSDLHLVKFHWLQSVQVQMLSSFRSVAPIHISVTFLSCKKCVVRKNHCTMNMFLHSVEGNCGVHQRPQRPDGCLSSGTFSQPPSKTVCPGSRGNTGRPFPSKGQNSWMCIHYYYNCFLGFDCLCWNHLKW